MKTKLTELIDQELVKYSTASYAYEKLNIIHTIIQLKLKLRSDTNNIPIYADVKHYVKLTIEAVDNPADNYYSLELNKIVSVIEHLNIHEQIKALEYFYTLIKIENINFNTAELKTLIKKKKLKYFFKSKISTPKLLDFVSILITYNSITLILSIVILFSIYCLLLAPATDENCVYITTSFVKYTSNSVVNHLLNVMSSIFQIDDLVVVRPKTWQGTIILVTAKAFTITIVANILYKELRQNFGMDE